MRTARHRQTLGLKQPEACHAAFNIMRRLSPFAAPLGSVVAKHQPQAATPVRGPGHGIAHSGEAHGRAEKAIATCAEPMKHLVPEEVN
jgi:hypothetical protein